MKKKITILVTGIFITVAAISGCGSDPTNKTETPKAEATTRLDLSSESTHSNINWKEHPLLSKLPDPNTQKVKIESEDSSSINLYISDVSQGGFSKYADLCKDSGFNVDFSYSDNFFTAGSSDGYDLTLSYDNGEKKMDIYLYALDESESTATETTTEKKEEVTTKSKPTTTAEKGASSEIRPEVKKAIDSYESFMNKYIDFMKKYSESNDAVSMANDYAEYMEKYTKVIKDFDALKDNDLNDTELKYYLEVQNKINTDLISIQ